MEKGECEFGWTKKDSVMVEMTNFLLYFINSTNTFRIDLFICDLLLIVIYGRRKELIPFLLNGPSIS